MSESGKNKGGSGIRTRDTVAGTPDFKSGRDHGRVVAPAADSGNCGGERGVQRRAAAPAAPQTAQTRHSASDASASLIVAAMRLARSRAAGLAVVLIVVVGAGCEVLSPNVSRAIDMEKVRHAEERQAAALERIATAVERGCGETGGGAR